MDISEPTDAHRRLARLGGNWSGDEKMLPSQWDPQGSVARAHHVSRVAMGGFAVLDDYEQERDGHSVYSGHGVWTVDPNDEGNECVLYWFDSLGTGLETFRGGWDGDVLTMRSQNPMGSFRLTYDLSEPDAIGARMEFSSDGEQWGAMFEATYRRQE